MIISGSVLLRMSNVLDKSFGEKSEHAFYVQKLYENRAVYGLMWRNIVEPDRPHMTIWRMRIACWTPKAKNKHSEYVITYCFYTGTVVAGTRLVTCIRTLRVLLTH